MKPLRYLSRFLEPAVHLLAAAAVTAVTTVTTVTGRIKHNLSSTESPDVWDQRPGGGVTCVGATCVGVTCAKRVTCVGVTCGVGHLCGGHLCVVGHLCEVGHLWGSSCWGQSWWCLMKNLSADSLSASDTEQLFNTLTHGSLEHTHTHKRDWCEWGRWCEWGPWGEWGLTGPAAGCASALCCTAAAAGSPEL